MSSARPLLTAGRAVQLASTVSAAVHALLLAGCPLVLTPDSGEYLNAAANMLSGQAPGMQDHRTPGYPAILAAIFWLCGPGPGGVLLVQHVLAVATTACLTRAACAVSRPSIGLAVGLVAACEPWSMLFATYALTETTTLFCIAAAAAIATRRGKAGWAAGAALGVLLGSAVMLRPALQSVVPFMLIAWVIGRTGPWKERLGPAAAAVAAGCLIVGPWVWHNMQRGRPPIAGGSGWVLFYGAAMHSLLDRDDDRVNPDIRRVALDALAPGASDWHAMQAVWRTNAHTDPLAAAELGAWARRSIARHPGAYAAAVWHSLRWQLHAGDAAHPPMYDELTFLLRRPGMAGDGRQPPNFQNVGLFPEAARFAMPPHAGPLQRLFDAVGEHLSGIPQVPLFIAAVLAAAVSAWRRRWPMVTLIAGSFAFLAAHCLLLVPVSRYALPAMSIWFLAAAYLAEEVAAFLGSRLLGRAARSAGAIGP
ncbi:MAG: glycosyltransferase family 39 protein [Phycisphaerales bacterium]|nr:glycosyltransferase family 39 protein [Phycisphaerales bacterium]